MRTTGHLRQHCHFHPPSPTSKPSASMSTHAHSNPPARARDLRSQITALNTWNATIADTLQCTSMFTHEPLVALRPQLAALAGWRTACSNTSRSPTQYPPSRVAHTSTTLHGYTMPRHAMPCTLVSFLRRIHLLYVAALLCLTCTLRPATSVVGSAFAAPVPAEEIHDARTDLSVLSKPHPLLPFVSSTEPAQFL